MSLFDEKPSVGFEDGQDVAYHLITIPAHPALWVSDFGLVPVGVGSPILLSDDQRFHLCPYPSIHQPGMAPLTVVPWCQTGLVVDSMDGFSSQGLYKLDSLGGLQLGLWKIFSTLDTLCQVTIKDAIVLHRFDSLLCQGVTSPTEIGQLVSYHGPQ